MSRSEHEDVREEPDRSGAPLGEATAAGGEPGENHLRTLLDAIPEIALVVGLDGKVVEANAFYCTHLGRPREQVLGIGLDDLYDSTTATRRRAWAAEVVQTREAQTYVDQREGKIYETTLHPVLSAGGEVVKLAIFVRDITPRGRAERQLRELLESVHLVAVILDTSGRVTLANPHLAELAGRKIEEIEGSDWFDNFIPAESREQIRDVFRRTLEQGQTPSHHENEIVTAIGERRLIRWSNSVLRDETGAVISIASLGEDVTDRRREQAALLRSRERLRALATQLSTIEDRERRRFATALHDEVSQELVVLRLKITSLLAQAPERMRPALEELQSLLGDCLDRTRHLTYDLSPPALYELGLEPALESVGERMAREHGLAFEFAVRGSHEPLVDDLAPVFYRAVRELLMNVIKHARATLVRVEIRRDFPFVAVVVEDDGDGFAPGWERVDGGMGGFGLFSIRERMRQLGGTLEIGRSALGGALVIVTCPISRPNDAAPASTG